MCRSHWNAPSPDDDNYDYCHRRWDFDCYGFVCLACNNRAGFAAVSSCVVMNTIDQRTMTAVGDGVCHRF